MRILGMMSGTSIDAIDTALVDIERDREDPELLHARLLAAEEHDWPEDLRRQLLAVLPPADSDVGTWTRLHTRVCLEHGRVARAVLAEHGGADLVVSHGQTLFHWVEGGTARGTLQIGDPARIHAATGVPVLSDLRAADIARGGQGAPLAPILDQLALGEEPTAALNLGGIANVTLVGTADGEVRAGDIGPANALIDAACLAATDGRESCDRDGRLARAGRVDARVLDALLEDPFFALPLPRSTGREHFDAGYVDRHVPDHGLDLPDLVATLTELTAVTVARTIAGSGVQRVIGSGGGMRNPALRERLTAHLDPLPLADAGAVGLPGDAKEALLMALIGWLTAHDLPGTVRRTDGSALTGADHPVVLGSLTPPVPIRLPDDPSTAPVQRLRLTLDPQETP